MESNFWWLLFASKLISKHERKMEYSLSPSIFSLSLFFSLTLSLSLTLSFSFALSLTFSLTVSFSHLFSLSRPFFLFSPFSNFLFLSLSRFPTLSLYHSFSLSPFSLTPSLSLTRMHITWVLQILQILKATAWGSTAMTAEQINIKHKLLQHVRMNEFFLFLIW